jgi:hypothetical protein
MKRKLKKPEERTHSIALQELSRQRGRRRSDPRVSKRVSVPPAVAGGPKSALREPVWAVIADHYVNFGLTHDEALAEVLQLRSKDQPGVVIVTNEAAKRMTRNAIAGVAVADLPDMRF